MAIRTSMRVWDLAKTMGFVVALGSVGCGGGDDGSRANGGAGGVGNAAGSGGSAAGSSIGGSGGTLSADRAMIRVVHASPDAPSVDVYVKGQKTPVIEGLGYGKSTEYLEVPSGDYVFELRAAGSEPDSTPAYTSPELMLMGAHMYSAVAAGMLGSKDLSDSFRVIALEDDFKAAASGDARVRVLHAGSDAPSVDIDVGNDGSNEISGIARFDATASEGTNLPAGQALQIALNSEGETAATFTTPALGDGSEVLVVATGLFSKKPRSGHGFGLLAVMKDGSTAFIRQNPIVYALHAAPDAGPVDIYVGDNEIIDNVSFGSLTRLQVPEGEYTLDFFPGHEGPSLRPTKPPAASAATPKLEAGEEYLILANGLLASSPSTFQLTAYQDLFADDNDDTARIRAVHASPNAPAVDVSTVGASGTLDEPPLAQKIAFTHATAPDGAGVPPGSYTIGIAPTGSMMPIVKFSLSVGPNQRAYAVAAGLLGNNSEPFRLFVIDSSEPRWSISTVNPQ